jgi:hypothetical protein
VLAFLARPDATAQQLAQWWDDFADLGDVVEQIRVRLDVLTNRYEKAPAVHAMCRAMGGA